eukprot:3405077-Rhodomonas_salina.2
MPTRHAPENTAGFVQSEQDVQRSLGSIGVWALTGLHNRPESCRECLMVGCGLQDSDEVVKNTEAALRSKVVSSWYASGPGTKQRNHKTQSLWIRFATWVPSFDPRGTENNATLLFINAQLARLALTRCKEAMMP